MRNGAGVMRTARDGIRGFGDLHVGGGPGDDGDENAATPVAAPRAGEIYAMFAANFAGSASNAGPQPAQQK
ncbi:hypothetical protein GCM10009786_14100 [Leucobacter alluvii]|uniref:Uncharacterized protein n=1 Tax=Leucobacter alluvii TaxID=340321 RepID=A0ABN3B651_9MICO